MTTDTTTTTAPRLSVKPFNKYATRDEFKRDFAATGSHYFDPATVRAFGANLGAVKVGPRGLAVLFIESTWTGFDKTARGYRVRLATAWGQIFDFDGAGNLTRSTPDGYMTITAARKLFASVELDEIELGAARWSAFDRSKAAEFDAAQAVKDYAALAAL